MHGVADVVVIADGVQGLFLGVLAEPQQLRVEDPLLGDRVHVQSGGERLPHPLHRGHVQWIPRLQIVQVGELLTEPGVIIEDELGDVRHDRAG